MGGAEPRKGSAAETRRALEGAVGAPPDSCPHKQVGRWAVKWHDPSSRRAEHGALGALPIPHRARTKDTGCHLCGPKID